MGNRRCKIWRRVVAVLLALTFLSAYLPEDIIDLDITVSAETYTTEDGFKYTITDGEVTITGYSGDATDVVIPNEIEGCAVTTIGSDAFSDCKSLMSVTIPDSIVSIEWYAFCGCSNLASITIPNCVTNIGDNAFTDCDSLVSIEISSSVTSIGRTVFEGCSKLTSINVNENNNFFKSIDGVLYDRTVTEIIAYPAGKVTDEYKINDGVEIISPCAFEGCINLKSVSIPSTVTDIGYGSFRGCINLKELIIPDGVTSIGSDAFSRCSSLTNIVIPNGVTRIHSGMFFNCSNLSNVILSNNIVEIGDSAFSNCISLTNITIPDSVTEIGPRAFASSNLYSISIPENVSSIGFDTFNRCYNLKNISIGDGISYIGENAFANTAYYNELDNWESGLLYINKYLIKANNSTIVDNIIVKGNTLVIANEAFSNCYNLKSIDIPDTIIDISYCTFSFCSNLESINLSKNLTQIGSGAFSGCKKLATISLPDSLKKIGYSAFSGCSTLTSITIPDGVKYIDMGTFSGCSNLSKIVIPKSVSDIFIPYTIPDSLANMPGCFQGCDNLTIYGYAGSYAETYAKENEIPFVALDEDSDVAETEPPYFSSQLKLEIENCGDTERLLAWITNYDGDHSDVSFSIGNTDIAYIKNWKKSEFGEYYIYITSKAVGETEIYGTVDGRTNEFCKIICKPTTGDITFLPEEISVNEDSEIEITANVANEDTVNSEFRFADESIAKISGKEKKSFSGGTLNSYNITVKGIAEGSTQLCYYENGYLLKSCNVTVLPRNAENPIISSSDSIDDFDDRFYVQVYKRLNDELVPFENAKVSVYLSSGREENDMSSYTDKNGLCFLDGIPEMLRSVYVSADGY